MTAPATSYTVSTFADPYKRCRTCAGWITGATEAPGLPLSVNPCGHMGGYEDVCRSWSPVTGCSCPPAAHDRPDHLAYGVTL